MKGASGPVPRMSGRMNIGRPKRVFEVEPVSIPVPEVLPVPETEPQAEPLPAGEPVPAAEPTAPSP